MTRAIQRDHARLLAGRALTVPERLRRRAALETGDRDEAAVTELLSEWREQFPTEAAFRRRLARLDADETDVRWAIRADRFAPSASLPAWVERLDGLVADATDQTVTGAETRRRLRSEASRDVMFPALSARLAAVVTERLPESVRSRLPDRVLTTAAEWFRRRFHRRFDRMWFVEFKTFVAAHDRDLAFADPADYDDPPTAYYERFQTYLFDGGGLADVCVEYPVFGRLLATQAEQWVSYLTELTERLRADRAALADRFGDGDLGELTGVAPLADDTHGDGRAVAKLSFDCGTTVVYKPRPVEAGERVYELLTDLEDHLSVPSFEAPTYLDRGSYGWMEWVPEEDCADETAVARYYERAGALAALAYLTEFTDCHHENLVAAGDQPTLVDAETVFHPRLRPAERPAGTGAGGAHRQSVVLSALLPRAVGDEDAFGTATAGIAVTAESTPVPGVTVPRLAAAGSDVVDVTEQPGEIEPEANVPTVGGEPALPDGYADELVAGFREAYETLVSLTDRGVIDLEARFAGVDNRLVYRPTMQYARLIDDLQSAQTLADGVRVDVELAELAASACRGVDDPPWGIVEAERAALLGLDPPRFGARVDGTALSRDGEPVGAFAAESGLSVARERLDEAGPSDLAAQTEYVRGAFDGPLVDDRRDDPPTDPPVPDTAERRRAAVTAWERIDDAATWVDGVPYWEWIAPWGDDETLSVRHADESLYFGRTGVALLPAALYRVTGDERFRTAARAVLAPTRDRVETAVGEGVGALGGTGGVGAVAYGLAAVGELLDDETVTADAARALDGLSSAAIQADETYDVIGGSAGTLLGLLGAYDRTGDESFLSWARECGDRLVDAQRPVEAGGAAWPTGDDGTPLVGFSHGSSGIAYGLARLAAVTGDDQYGTAVDEALRYEAAVYDSERENWPDLRGGDVSFTDQWCHGRAGVVLARLGVDAAVDGDPVDRAVERATSVARTADTRVDHLCCGAAGAAETLIEARRRGWDLQSPAPTVGRLVERISGPGGLVTLSHTRHVRDPSLFHGLAGVGYTVLRSGSPDRVPSVLLWE